MNKKSAETESKLTERLNGLFDYVRHVGTLNQRPIFRIEEYKQLNIWEHELKGRIGIQHNIVDDDGTTIWLRIDRLKRTGPPLIPKQIQDWITVGNDPESKPSVTEKLIKSLSEQEAKELVNEGIVAESDVTSPLKEQITGIKKKDVIFRLQNNPQVKADIDSYLNNQWLPWSEEEKPRRQTIKIYDSFFSLQQTIESLGDEQPIELIWGIGISRWKCEGHIINHPLLEKPIEIEVVRKDGAILILPRNIDPTLNLGAYFALENSGAGSLLRFEKKHFSEMSEDIEFSPYIDESFEPLLRFASTQLSESGTYWPNVNPDKENRGLNKISESLEVTDSWVIFARPRSSNGFVQDIERFQKKIEAPNNTDCQIPNLVKKLVTELCDKKPLQASGGVLLNSSCTSPQITQKKELFFPKVFNDSQVNIVDRLEENDGVVVQGPPGTGKTHTIANIICHYLATGRRVLVTSKGEPALSVLQEQIPKELRSLTISLLGNERQGMKQLESAVELLASLVSRTSLRELEQEAASNDLRVKQLNREIVEIDEDIKAWGQKQLNPVGSKMSGKSTDMTAMELAQLVINDTDDHDWLSDELGGSDKYNPVFTDSDIAEIRVARRNVGKDIVYVSKLIPSTQDLPSVGHIVAFHDDISASEKISVSSRSNHIPPLAVSVTQSVDRAKKLIKPLQEISNLLMIFEDNHWLQRLGFAPKLVEIRT